MIKKLISLIGLLVAAALLGGCTAAAAPAGCQPPVRQINVTGSGQVYLVPDVAYIYIGVHSQSANVSEALQTNNAQSKAVSDALKGLGVAEKDIQTTNLNIFPQQQYDPQGKVTGTIYMVDNTVYVTVRNLDTIGRLLDTVVQSGANNINGIQFDVLDRKPALAQARNLAIEDARKQAEDIAAAAGVTLGALQSVGVSSGSPLSMMDSRAMGGGGMAAAKEAPVSAGQMLLTVNASVVYEIK